MTTSDEGQLHTETLACSSAALNRSDPRSSSPAGRAVRTAFAAASARSPRNLGERHIPRVHDNIRQSRWRTLLINNRGDESADGKRTKGIRTHSGRRAREETRSVLRRSMSSGRTLGGREPVPSLNCRAFPVRTSWPGKERTGGDIGFQGP